MIVLKHSLKLLALVVSLETPIALVFTYIANITNTRGLAWVVLALWLIISACAGCSYWPKVAAQNIMGILMAAFILSFIFYTYIGYYGFGWTGLMKGHNQEPISIQTTPASNRDGGAWL
jgi:phosphoglycerol transferase MdoB-like AlkP superfamily enzyme